MHRPIRLGVNIDHVATIRNVRGGSRPDPVRAALIAQKAGADGITAHLREDRRHIRDVDMVRLKSEIALPLNFEMATTPEMLEIALRVRPHAACLVPEKREERTTEGGLDVVRFEETLKPFVAQLRDAGIRVSLFVEPDRAALEASVRLGAPVVELHTGSWCEAVERNAYERADAEFARLKAAVEVGTELGLEIHAGHGLDFDTARLIAALPQVIELNIGHFLIGEAVFTGLADAIGRMRAAMRQGREAAGVR